jgi:hypothetical protein
VARRVRFGHHEAPFFIIEEIRDRPKLVGVSRALARVYTMLKIPRRHSHFVYAVIQSGLTTAIAAAVASVPFLEGRSFLVHWLTSWMAAWAMMMPIVLLAAPVIRNVTYFLTHEEKT